MNVDELKFKGDVKSSLLYDVGMAKQEMDDYKLKSENLTEKNEKLRQELDDKITKIQELNFAKAHLTELIVENENTIHNLEVEKESYEKHCTDLKEERNVLRDYIEKMSAELQEDNSNLNKKYHKQTVT